MACAACNQPTVGDKGISEKNAKNGKNKLEVDFGDGGGSLNQPLHNIVYYSLGK